MVSEYQFYEFVAVDRPLGDEEFAAVRALSTRARMSRTHFVNGYQWGDFKGNPRTLVERYYDAHLYFANWGTRHLMLKLPAKLLAPETAACYEVAPLAEVWQHRASTILSFTSEDEEQEWDDDLEGALSGLIGVRAELAAGDLRPLYLAWLAGIGTWERDEDVFDDDFDGVPEPPLPAGLSTLTGPQRTLADFLRGPRPTRGRRRPKPHLRRCSRHRPQPAGLDHSVAGHGQERLPAPRRRGPRPPPPHRDAAPLRRPGATRRDQANRRRTAGRRSRTPRTRRRRGTPRRECPRARERYLTALVADREGAWLRVDAFIAAKKPREYDQAVELLQDLRELSRRDGTTDQFTDRIIRIRDEHARKTSLIARLDHARLGIPGRELNVPHDGDTNAERR